MRRETIPLEELTNREILCIFWDDNLQKIDGHQANIKMTLLDGEFCRLDVCIGYTVRFHCGFAKEDASREEVLHEARKHIRIKAMDVMEDWYAKDDGESYDRALARVIRKRKKWMGRAA